MKLENESLDQYFLISIVWPLKEHVKNNLRRDAVSQGVQPRIPLPHIFGSYISTPPPSRPCDYATYTSARFVPSNKSGTN